MASNGIDWEKAYGEKWSEMTPDQKDVAIVGMFNSLKKGQELSLLKIESFCEEQDKKNSRFDKAFWLCVLGIPVLYTATDGVKITTVVDRFKLVPV